MIYRNVPFVFLLVSSGHLATAQVPTWHEDISCIVHTHCAPCHYEGGPGHFSLATYEAAQWMRNEIKSATQTGYMPPWPPDPEYRSLAHERLLTQDEIDLIAAWADAGGPEGDPANALPPPPLPGAWQIPQPDLTSIMEEYLIPSSTTDNYRCFVLEIDNPTDRFITELEVVPGNREMVHHVLVFQDTTGQASILDQNEMGPGYSSFGGIGVPSAKLIGIWVPGADPFSTPAGMGIPLYAGADIVVQVHYPANSTPELDSTRVNLKLTTSPFTRPLSIDPILDHLITITNGPLVIPPNEVRTFHAQYTTTFPATITAIGPHSHLLGQRMWSFAIVPGGDTIPLIDIPDWDFRWQDVYSFRQPIHLPTGSTVHGYATYDNTANNPNNPNNPPQWVWLGESTTDEMMLFYFAWTYGFPSDVNIVVDTAAHKPHYLDCVPGQIVGIHDHGSMHLTVWPSPAIDMLHVGGAVPGTMLRMIDASGRVVHTERINGDPHQIGVGRLARGLYVLEIGAKDLVPVWRHKVMLE